MLPSAASGDHTSSEIDAEMWCQNKLHQYLIEVTEILISQHHKESKSRVNQAL